MGSKLQGKVFVVEDQDSILEMMIESLSLLDYEALAARDFDSALAMGKEKQSEIKVVMCDMVLGHHRGPDLIRELRRYVPDCPVIYTSGYAPEEIMRGDPHLSQALFLAKPFSLESLQEILEKALGPDESQQAP